MSPRPGPTNSIVDVSGIRVGHHTRDEPGWLTGVSVVLAPGRGAVGGVDVRGGGPGTRETDLLDPRNLVDRVNAVVLGGGSAFGLAAADGVMDGLLADGVGWPIGGPGQIVPIVPAAILFDLGRGGQWGHRPGPADGRAAYDAACRAATGSAVPQGNVGAGTGAKAGPFRGGFGSASVVLDSGVTVAAVVALNAVGSAVDLVSGLPYGIGLGLPGEFDHVRTPSEAEREAARALAAAAASRAGAGASDGSQEAAGSAPASLADGPDDVSGNVAERATGNAAGSVTGPGQATTIAVVATDAALTKAQCQKMAGVAHDGLARAIRPVHTLFDGDTVFTLATGEGPGPDPVEQTRIMEAGADALARAVAHAVLAAESVDRSADGGIRLTAWRDAFPSALR